MVSTVVTQHVEQADPLAATEERTTAGRICTHFGDATLEFRDAFVRSAQWFCLSNHGTHNGREFNHGI
jgi:hypothetical protein